MDPRGAAYDASASEHAHSLLLHDQRFSLSTRLPHFLSCMPLSRQLQECILYTHHVAIAFNTSSIPVDLRKTVYASLLVRASPLASKKVIVGAAKVFRVPSTGIRGRSRPSKAFIEGEVSWRRSEAWTTRGNLGRGRKYRAGSTGIHPSSRSPFLSLARRSDPFLTENSEKHARIAVPSLFGICQSHGSMLTDDLGTGGTSSCAAPT